MRRNHAARSAVDGELAAPRTSTAVTGSYGGWSSTAASCSRQCVRRVQARSVSPGAWFLPSAATHADGSLLVAASVIRRWAILPIEVVDGESGVLFGHHTTTGASGRSRPVTRLSRFELPASPNARSV